MAGKFLFANNATSRLRIDTPAGSATVTVPSGEGGKFPSPVAPDFFMATIDDRRTGQVEIVKCTGRSGDVIQVVRGQEGTTAQDFVLGALFSNRITAGTLANFMDAAAQIAGYTKTEADAKFVDATGDTVTGTLLLPAAAPTADAQAAHKGYVDTQILTRAASVHTHVIADVTGLQGALDGKVPQAPLDSKPYARLNLGWTDISGLATPSWDNVQGKPLAFLPSAHTHEMVDINGLSSALNTKEDKANKSQPGGYPMLDGSGLVPSTQLPSYVDDVREYANLAAFPATGTTGIIFVALDTGRIYRWSGSTYIEISPSPGSTDSVPEGSVNLYFTTARALASAPVQEPASGFNLRTPGSWVAGVRLSGDTMTGALTLPGDPTADLQAAPRQYVDKRVGTGMSFFDYMFNGAQYVAPPNSGNVRMNNANQTLATKIWLHDITYVNNDASNILDLIGVGDKFYIQDKDNSAQWQRYLITAIADMGTYHEFSVTWEAGGSALANQRIGIFTLRASSSGSGAATAIGDTPPASPVAGQLWWNSASGELYIRYADADSSQWVVAVLPPVSVPEAPTDGKIYARQNGAWVSPRAARLTRATAQSINNVAVTLVSWSTATFDIGGFWNAGAPTRLTVPAGVSLVRVTGQSDWISNLTGERYISITRNGGAIPLAVDRRSSPSMTEANFSTGPVQVAAGDYFEMSAYQSSGGALNFNNAPAAWFSIEVLG